MSRPNPLALGTFLVAVWAVLGGVALLKGGFYLAKHEGDTLHLLQIVFRMADGEWPHLDFMTPIGVLAFAPIVLFVQLGAGVGHAIILSQLLLGIALLPALWWAGYSRLTSPLAYLFGLFVLVLVLALVPGETERSVSISMHYNRWAWALAYVAILLAVLPRPDQPDAAADGIILGLCMAGLMLCKMTYFVAFAPPVVAALALRGAWRSLGLALAAGAAVMLVITVWAGPGFWWAYAQDLLTVARSDVRPQPGPPLRTVIGAPAYLGGSLVLLAAVILLRQAGEKGLGLALLLLVPAFFYVTYQNFGTDPQWLGLLAILLLTPRPAPELRNGMGWPLRTALTVCATAALAFGTPSLLNLAYSPFRHLALKPADYAPMLAAMPRHDDLRSRVMRANRVDGIVGLDGPGSGLETRRTSAARAETETLWRSEILPDCELVSGMVAWFETIVGDIETADLAKSRRIFAADIFSSHWLFGDLTRLQGGAPWYYGALSGFDNADYLLVPLCPTSMSVRKEVLAAVAERGIALTEMRRTPLYILYAISES